MKLGCVGPDSVENEPISLNTVPGVLVTDVALVGVTSVLFSLSDPSSVDILLPVLETLRGVRRRPALEGLRREIALRLVGVILVGVR